MVTIKDIAKHCGVSVSTVSYALSNHSTISEKTKEKIRKVAKELNYIPNANARSLKHKSTNKIGVFVPGFQGTIHPSILAGIAHVLRNIEDKYNMIVTFTDDDMLMIKNHSVDLAIIMDGKTTQKTIKDLSAYVPIITFDQNSIGENIYTTSVDNFNATYQLTKHLIDQGCKRIGFILGSHASYHNTIRFEAYKKALADTQIQFDSDIVYDADAFTIYKGWEVISNHIDSKSKLPFDGLVCCNDELAIGAIKALTENGYKVPTDCLITGFDNIDQARYHDPTITTAHIDWYEYGIKIAELALRILKKEHHESSFIISAEIIKRESSQI
ncbi:MAG: LacI family transcriptional regulator [Acholeplasmataceae bacterium]|nr:LacI family transcriptional regulator [Acholeplasmataceae bacterium]